MQPSVPFLSLGFPHRRGPEGVRMSTFSSSCTFSSPRRCQVVIAWWLFYEPVPSVVGPGQAGVLYLMENKPQNPLAASG